MQDMNLQGAEGQSALGVLAAHLDRARQQMSTTEHPQMQPPAKRTRSADAQLAVVADDGDSIAGRVLAALEMGGHAHVCNGELRVQNAILAATTSTATCVKRKQMELLSPSEVVSTGPGGAGVGPPNVAGDSVVEGGGCGAISVASAAPQTVIIQERQGTAKHEAEFVARVSARWLAESGHGSIDVHEQGSLATLASGTQACFRLEERASALNSHVVTGAHMHAAHRRDAQQWTWDMLCSVDAEDAGATQTLTQAVGAGAASGPGHDR